MLAAIAERMTADEQRLAALCTRENGKPLKESLAEVRYAASFLSWFGGEAERIYGETIPASHTNQRLVAIRERQAKIIGLVPAKGATAWEVSRAMFPDTDDVHRFLAVSEAVAHLDYAHAEDKLAMERSDGREVYRKLSTD